MQNEQNLNTAPPPLTQPPADINGNHKDLDTHTLIGILLLAFIYPIGLIFMWFMTKWPKWVKLLLTVPVLFIILGLILVWYSYYVLSSNGFYNTTEKSSANSAQNIIPSSSPTPDSTVADETADWKTYTNTKVGFIFKYPPRFPKPMLPSGAADSPTVYATGTEDHADIIFGETSDDTYTLKIFPTQESIDQIIKNPTYIGHSDKIVVVKKLTVAGTEAIWSISVHPTVYPEDKSIHTLIFFKHLNYGFIFDTYNSNSENEINQILSTFKFTQ